MHTEGQSRTTPISRHSSHSAQHKHSDNGEFLYNAHPTTPQNMQYLCLRQHWAWPGGRKTGSETRSCRRPHPSGCGLSRRHPCHCQQLANTPLGGAKTEGDWHRTLERQTFILISPHDIGGQEVANVTHLRKATRNGFHSFAFTTPFKDNVGI